MRFMVMIKATPQTEAGQMPGEDVLRPRAATTKTGQRWRAARRRGPAASKGARVRFEGERCSVIDGPFAETRELIAGFWLFRPLRYTRRSTGRGAAAVRHRRGGDRDPPSSEAEDFGAEFTPELREQKNACAQLNH